MIVHQGGLVHPGSPAQAPFLVQPVPERRIRERLQHAEEGRGDRSFLHEVDDSLTGPGFLAVESDDESRHHPQSGSAIL